MVSLFQSRNKSFEAKYSKRAEKNKVIYFLNRVNCLPVKTSVMKNSIRRLIN